MDQQKVHDWVIQVFAVVGILQPPLHMVGFYCEQLLKGSISFQQVQNEVLALSRQTSPTTQLTQITQPIQPLQTTQPIQTTQTTQPIQPTMIPNTQAAQSTVAPQFKPIQASNTELQGTGNVSSVMAALLHEEEKRKIQEQIGVAPSSLQTDQLKEYADQLFITYTGRRGDPASTQYIINGILNKTLSFTQAELFVKFSKEAKAYQKTKEKNKESERVAKVKEYVKELYRVFLKDYTPTEDDIKSYAESILRSERTLQDVEDEFKLMSLSPPS